MPRLPDSERILNAYAAGFAPMWIARRFGVSYSATQGVIYMARKAGDHRASFLKSTIAGGRRWVGKHRNISDQPAKSFGVDANEMALRADQFPDLPEISEPILPFGGRVPNMDETA